MKIDTLKTRWISLFGEELDRSKVENGFADLANKYSEKHRFYHTFQHVSACLNALDQVADLVLDQFSVEVALWFHDVIYNPRKNNNELLSAKYAQEFLERAHSNQQTIDKIVHLINLTKHPSNPVTTDEQYLVDIDLLILGADTPLYDSYEHWIRKEYSFVPGFLYKKGRTKLLKFFLNSDKIYHTHYFFEKYESRARSNIIRALQML